MTAPFDDGAHDRILREARLKDIARRQGYERGRQDALAERAREFDELRRKVDAMWDAFCREETHVMRRLDPDCREAAELKAPRRPDRSASG